MVFHVLNRGVGRMRLFDKDGDYAAFERVLEETLNVQPMRLGAYCLMPNHWHMVLWPRQDGDLAAFMQRLSITHVRRWQGYRASLSRSLQIVPRGERWALPHRVPVCGTQRPAGELGGTGGGLALVQFVATPARGWPKPKLFESLAGRSSAGLGGTGQPAPDGSGARSAAFVHYAGAPVW